MQSYDWEGVIGVISVIIPVVAIVAWVTYMVVVTVTRSRLRELEVRERIAMIEKGIVPPVREPEAKPEIAPPRIDPRTPYRAYKFRSAGITMIAVGLGLMVLMFPNFRVGAFLAIVGVGFVVSGLLDRRTGGSSL